MKLGIDIGGTDTKFAVVDNDKIIYKSKIASNKESAECFIDEICAEAVKILSEYQYSSIGIGVAGSVTDGLVYSGNLPFKNYPVRAEIEKRIGIKTVIDNDANCAAYGEYLGGTGHKNIVLLTIGTGIGGGIVIDGKLCCRNGYIGEFGHMIVDAKEGLPCPCGQNGCWEQYASASALVRMSEKAAENNPDSYLGKLYKGNKRLTGEKIFEALDRNCVIAEECFNEYLEWLAIGIKNTKMILNPDAIILSGGITRQGDKLLKPLKQKLGSDINVEISMLGSNAGVFGAANLI